MNFSFVIKVTDTSLILQPLPRQLLRKGKKELNLTSPGFILYCLLYLQKKMKKSEILAIALVAYGVYLNGL